ncbi:MAG: glycosyltransferase family 9 protein [Deltaproteobacteria bacterium]|nr:glycosyltransferase family 9 protein [Deltaproteobacteria bacterium]
MKILIIRAGALGDTLMLMPFINAMRGEHEIIIAGRSPGIEYLDPWADKCIDLERGEWHRLYSPGAMFDTLSPAPDQVTGFLTDREYIVKDNLSYLIPDAKISIFPPFPATGSKTHVALYMAEAIQSTGIRIDPLNAFNEAFKKPLIRSEKGRGWNIVIHPGSGSMKKNYSPEFWLDLLRGIRKENLPGSLKVTVLIGPAEEKIIRRFDRKADIFISHNRKELLSILDNTSLFIGHDSGVTHLAAMMGINTIALFRGSSIKNWQPLGPFVKVVEEKGNIKKIQNKVLTLISDMLRQVSDAYG